MESILIGVHVLAAVAIVGLVLMQQGKGADAGASFGGGASQTMFGSSGSGNFLTRSTTWMVVVFFITSLGLAVVARQRAEVGTGESSLISGDLEQITREQEQQRLQAEEFPEIDFGGALDELPALDTDADFPEVEAAVEEAQAVLEEVQTEVEAAASELELPDVNPAE